MRQLRLTFTAQTVFRLPFKRCRANPGKSISPGFSATFRFVSISLTFAACFACMPEVLPVLKKFSSPLCRKLLIMHHSVMSYITLCNNNQPAARKPYSPVFEGKKPALRGHNRQNRQEACWFGTCRFAAAVMLAWLSGLFSRSKSGF